MTSTLIYAPTIKIMRQQTTGPSPALNEFPTADVELTSMITIYTGEEAVLEAGPADPTDPGQITPLDYDAVTNNKHWRQVS